MPSTSPVPHPSFRSLDRPHTALPVTRLTSLSVVHLPLHNVDGNDCLEGPEHLFTEQPFALMSQRSILTGGYLYVLTTSAVDAVTFSVSVLLAASNFAIACLMVVGLSAIA